jgi:hypothetical protein
MCPHCRWRNLQGVSRQRRTTMGNPLLWKENCFLSRRSGRRGARRRTPVMELVAVPAGTIMMAEVGAVAIAVEARVVVVTVTVPTCQAGARTTAATVVGNLVTRLESVEASSPRRRSRPIQPRKRSPASCLWSSTSLTRTIQICPVMAAHQEGWISSGSRGWRTSVLGEMTQLTSVRVLQVAHRPGERLRPQASHKSSASPTTQGSSYTSTSKGCMPRSVMRATRIPTGGCWTPGPQIT